MHGRTPTFLYFYRLNLGPDLACSFCGLGRESDEHILSKCQKSQIVWNFLIRHFTGLTFKVIQNFTFGDWTLIRWKTKLGSQVIYPILASCAWLLWKARCNKVVNNIDPNFNNLAFHAARLAFGCSKDTRSSTEKLTYSLF